MAGVMQKYGNPAGQMPPTEEKEAPETPEQEAAEQEAPSGPNAATPEEQQSFEQTVENGRRVLFDQKTHKQAMEAIKSAPSVAEGLGSLVSTIVIELDRKSGGNLPETVIIPAASELIDHAAEVAEAMGIEVDEETMKQANQVAVMKLLQNYGADEADMEGVMSQFSDDEIGKMRQEQQGMAGRWAPRDKQYAGAQQSAPAAPAETPGAPA